MLKRWRTLLVVLVSMVVVGCAQFGLQQSTKEGRLLQAMSLYNSLFEDYKYNFEVMQAGGFTLKEKKYLDGYKNMLTQTWVVINGYHAAVVAGSVSEENERNLISAVRLLSGWIEGRIDNE